MRLFQNRNSRVRVRARAHILKISRARVFWNYAPEPQASKDRKNGGGSLNVQFANRKLVTVVLIIILDRYSRTAVLFRQRYGSKHGRPKIAEFCFSGGLR